MFFTKKSIPIKKQKSINFLNANSIHKEREKSTPKKLPNIDFLKPLELENINTVNPPTATSRTKKIFVYCFIFIIITLVGFTTQIIISGSETSRSFGGIGILSQIKNLLLKDKHSIAGIKDNRINIALLGIGGEGHQGPYLTDTIILASLKPEEKIASLISIPRDLYITSFKIKTGSKINAIYAEGNMYKERGGGELVKEVLGEQFGIPIHYYARIDFNGFIELVDTLSGIDIYIEKNFTDNQFPAKNFATQTVTFTAGPNHMDGLTALQYVRSRHGTNGEAGDFARARRQQQVLLALKDKLIKQSIIKPYKINKMIEILGSSIETDMEIWEIIELADAFKSISEEDIIRYVYDDSPQGLLQSITGIDGAFLLIPKDKEQFRAVVQNIFDLNTIAKEKATIVIKNGTTTQGFAHNTKTMLEQSGFTIIKTENAEKQSYTKTVVYDLTQGKKQTSLRYLKNTLQANISSAIPPEIWQENIGADFVIVLGEEGSRN